jgi:aromatic ring hydroxylase
VFIIPVATPGLKIVCRESFTKLGSVVDHPLSARFDEMDAVAVFDDVLVPWERVFLYGDVRVGAHLYTGTRVRELTAHQTNPRLLSKIEFVYGVLCLMAEAIGVHNAPAVQETLGEAATYIETLRSILLASEMEAAVDPTNGIMYPALSPLQVGRTWGPRIYPRLMEMIHRLGAGGLMQLRPRSTPLIVLSDGIWRSITVAPISLHGTRCNCSNSPGISLARTLVLAIPCTSCFTPEILVC